MTTHRLVVLLVAACFVSVAVAAPQATGSKKDENSNIIPVDGVAKTSSAEPAVAADTADSNNSSSSTSTTSRPATKAPARPALGSGFSRFISDIFQIPISVLRAVNNLLTNPFNRDAAAAAPKKTDQ